MTRALYLIATWCARHAKLVLGLWIVALLMFNILNNRLPAAGVQEINLEGTDSAVGQTLLSRAFTGASTGAQPVVMGCQTDLDTGSGATIVANTRDQLKQVPGVLSVTGPAQQEDLLSADKQIAILQVQVADAQLGEKSTAQDILTTATEAAPECEVAVGGTMGQLLSSGESTASEGLGLLAAVIVLMFALRRFAAASVPLINAIMSVGIGSAIVGLLGRLVYIPDAAPILGTMLGLGVGIDYALFLVVRHRTMLRKGFEVEDSIGRTAGTAGAGMVFAGTTLILAVSGLALTRISFLAWLGYAAAVVVAVAVLASLTLVPALFSLMKYRVMPKKDRTKHHNDDSHLDEGMWARIADAVTTKPWRFAIGATLVLLIMAFPVTKMEFGQMDSSFLPTTSTGYQANQLITEGFGAGYNGPLAVVVQMNKPAKAPKDVKLESGTDPRTEDPRLTSLEEALKDTPGIQNVGDAIVSPDGGVAVIQVTPTTGPGDPATQVLVTTLREEVLPAATTGESMDAHVAGMTAIMMDLSVQIGASLPIFIGGVVLLSAFLLLLAYRSLVIPVKAAVMNLLSICAAYGVVVMVFQYGWGAELIGMDRLVPIETYVPMIMFAVLFGLSMDYEVFLLTAFQEHWAKTGDMVVSVRRGLADTGAVVTSAAAIMCVVFSSFIFLAPDAIAKLFGVGLATAVFVDASIVRCLLVPALMVLAASITWWLPKWLDKALPHLHIEGDPDSLESIHTPPADHTPHTVAEATTPATGVLPVALGAAVGWIVGSRVAPVDQSVPYATIAVAVSAVVGGLIVWLPRGTPGAGFRPGTRIIAFLGGAMGVAILYALIRALIPYTKQNPGVMAAWALLVIVIVGAFTKLRRYGLPFILGGIVMAVTIAVSGVGDTGLGTLMQLAIVPAFIAGLVALAIERLVFLLRDDSPPPGEPPEPPEPDDADSPQLTGVGS
ncbi:MAG: MMPL family transporter [Candidatus Nanopelagicales bacterium]